ncbi:hypothetical protein QQ045_000218 [Rhodiola kirilowii]
MPNGLLGDWLWWCVTSLDQGRLCWFLVSLWLCWKNRNRVWHDDICWDVSRAAFIGKNFWNLYVRSNQITWVGNTWGETLRENDVVKINCDCSWDRGCDIMGIGVVFSRQGKLFEGVLADWGRRSACVSEGEGAALLKGMNWAKERKYASVAFEIDSAEVYKAVCLGLGIGDWCTPWLEEAASLLDSNRGWSISLVNRECNRWADQLARRARQELWRWEDFLSIPRWFGAFV